jgi:hypothetical protein
MHLRNLIAGVCLLACIAIVDEARAEGRSTTSLQINVIVREVVKPHRPPKAETPDITFSLASQNRLSQKVEERRLSTPTQAVLPAKDRDAVIRTTTYTIE